MGIFSGIADAGTWVGGRAADVGRGTYRLGGEIKDQITGANAANAARAAAGIQSKAAADANTEARRQYDLNRADQSPWLNIGKSNLERLNAGMESGEFNTPDPGQYRSPEYQDPGQGPMDFQYREFSPGDLENDPGYQFRMAQGLKGIQNTRAGSGSLKSGATLKALLGYGQGLASDEMGAAYGRFQDQRNFSNNVFQNKRAAFQDSRNFGRGAFESDRSFGANQFQQGYQNRVGANQDRFNRLASIAGVGQSAAQNLGAQGANFSQAYGNNVMGGANAQAAGKVGAANAYTGAFNNLLNLGAQGATAYMGMGTK